MESAKRKRLRDFGLKPREVRNQSDRHLPKERLGSSESTSSGGTIKPQRSPFRFLLLYALALFA
jgi:hypothetical protein